MAVIPVTARQSVVRAFFRGRGGKRNVSQADLATNIDEQKVGDLVEAISAAP